MSDKITSNMKLAKKIKKLETHQETVLAGVADHLTEEEKSNFSLALSKLDQFSNNIKVEEATPSHQNTTEKPKFEAFFTLFKLELHAYEQSDKMDCLMFSSVELFRFTTYLYNSFNSKYYQRYITELIIFENQANHVLLFLASDRGFKLFQNARRLFTEEYHMRRLYHWTKTIIYDSEQSYQTS